MKRLILCFAVLLCCKPEARAQFGNFGDIPIDITAERTSFERSVATADENVMIRYGEILIYCDHAQYNPETRDVLVQGNVRIYREGRFFTGERAIYNLETKQLDAADFRGEFTPFRFSGDTLSTLGPNAYLVKNGLFTTSDSSHPGYYLRAKTVRVYPKDRIIFKNVKVYFGGTPVFWFPYIYQSLNKDQGFLITPGYSSLWGPFLLGQYNFPLFNTVGKVRLDFLANRGVGLGLESRWDAKHDAQKADDSTESILPSAPTHNNGTDKGNWGRFRSYYIEDSKPGENKTALAREPIDPSRYRVSFQNRTYLTEDIYATVDINKLSDARFLQDFEPGEFRTNPNPDNAIFFTKWNEDYTATLIARKNLNEESFDGTERLPELALDLKRQPIFGKGFFYDGESSTGFYRRNFAGGALVSDYDTFRADTFHQISYPGTYFGWLSLVPKVGVRGTFYSESGHYGAANEATSSANETNQVDTSSSTTLTKQGSLFRPVVNAGLEASFKFSRAFESVQSRTWGLDALRHVVQPYTNFSYVYSGQDPIDILQFDRLNRSTQLPPIDFPQFNTIDSIDTWTILRLGVRNRLETRRDNVTINWLEVDTFVDVNIDRPNFLGAINPDGGTFSNVYNRLRFNPLPWLAFTLDSQLPLLDSGFSEINSSFNFLINADFSINVGHRYISGNTIIYDSNLLTFGAYYRLDDNWALGFSDRYEFQTNLMESQRYEIHRDLSSWVASVGIVINTNHSSEKGNVNDYGIQLTFTLKDLPTIRLPFVLDPSSLAGGGGTGKNP